MTMNPTSYKWESTGKNTLMRLVNSLCSKSMNECHLAPKLNFIEKTYINMQGGKNLRLRWLENHNPATTIGPLYEG